MGKLRSEGWSRLTEILKENGEDWLVGQLVTRVADGEEPWAIAKTLGVPYVCVKKWAEENAVDLIALGRRARADVLVGEAVRHVDEAQIEDVALARLKAETKLKVAAKLDRVAYGEGGMVGGGGGMSVTIVIGDVIPAEVVPEIDGEVIEGEVVV